MFTLFSFTALSTSDELLIISSSLVSTASFLLALFLDKNVLNKLTFPNPNKELTGPPVKNKKTNNTIFHFSAPSFPSFRYKI